MSAEHPAATTESRDPFADDVLERLIRSNAQYQQTHGHYIVPLAERLLASRAEVEHLREELRQGGSSPEVEGTVPSQWWLDLKLENQELRSQNARLQELGRAWQADRIRTGKAAAGIVVPVALDSTQLAALRLLLSQIGFAIDNYLLATTEPDQAELKAKLAADYAEKAERAVVDKDNEPEI